jgi:Arc/MetJ family transcription regulator
MRTTIVIDDELLKAAEEATGLRTRSAVVEKGLKLLVKMDREIEGLNPLWEAIATEGEVRLVRKGQQPD